MSKREILSHRFARADRKKWRQTLCPYALGFAFRHGVVIMKPSAISRQRSDERRKAGHRELAAES
jgi:hypothetical protein